MKKYCFCILLFALGCSKKGEKETATQAILTGSSWQTYHYYLNGVQDAAIEARVPFIKFGKDSIYMRRINPLERDTFLYEYMNEQNIRMTKPWLPSSPAINLKIDLLINDSLDFTITNGTGKSELYKTRRI